MRRPDGKALESRSGKLERLSCVGTTRLVMAPPGATESAWSCVTADQPPRCRPVPPHVVDAVRDRTPAVSEAELVDRLERALAALPPAERSAVVAAVGYGEGAVGAAMEVELELEQAHALAQSGLQLLRAALADLDEGLDSRR